MHDLSKVLSPNPPQLYAKPQDPKSSKASIAAAGVVGAIAGAGVVAGVMKTKNLPEKEED